MNKRNNKKETLENEADSMRSFFKQAKDIEKRIGFLEVRAQKEGKPIQGLRLVIGGIGKDIESAK